MTVTPVDNFYLNNACYLLEENLQEVILPTAPAVSNEGGSSPLLALAPAVSWPRVPAWGSLEPPRRDGENAQKTGKNREKMGEIRPKTCEGRELTKDQLGGARGLRGARVEGREG